MADALFDPTGAVTFDLSSGNVNLARVSRRVLAPADGLSRLCEAAGEEAARGLGLSMGAAMGTRIAWYLRHDGSTDGLAAVSFERFIDHLRGEFALVGLGVVGMELWGKALLMVVRRAAMPVSFVASVLEGALREATGRPVVCVKLAESDSEMRYLAAGEQGASKVAAWVSQGLFWGDVLVKLQAPVRADAGGAA